tara:strand:+ start:3171 stop:3740 length:570 start_codon:yes stop_codon:yes gene_type:complete
MANQDSPFGLRAIGKIGQNRDNQGLAEFSIAASATAIFGQDPVKALNTGTIGVAGAGDVLLGALNGVFFTDANTSKPTFANHLLAANTATDIVGFVSSDPYERFEIQSDNTTASAQTDVFMNYDITYSTGSTHDFISGVELDDSTTSATSGQLKVVGVSKDIKNNDLGASHVNFVVMINEHFLNSTAGV